MAQEVHWFLQHLFGFPAEPFDSLGRVKSLQLVCSQLGFVYRSLAGLRESLKKRGGDEDTDLLANFFGGGGHFEKDYLHS